MPWNVHINRWKWPITIFRCYTFTSWSWDVITLLTKNFHQVFFFCWVNRLKATRSSWFDNSRLNTWQLWWLEEVQAINKMLLCPIYIFCMKNVITILNQEILVDFLSAYCFFWWPNSWYLHAKLPVCLRLTVAPSNHGNRCIYINIWNFFFDRWIWAWIYTN